MPFSLTRCRLTPPAGPSRRPVTAALGRAALPLLALLAAAPAQATLMRPLCVAELTRGADVVVRGRVQDVHTGRAGTGVPVNGVELEVLEVLAGPLPPLRRLTISQPGGEIDGVALDFAGRPHFAPGQETVIFLVRRGSLFIPFAMAQGKFDVGPGSADGRRALSRSLEGAEMAGAPTEPPPTHLQELRARIAATPREISGGRR